MTDSGSRHPTRTRREFLSHAAALAGAAALSQGAAPPGSPRPAPARRPTSANDRIRCGFVGVGNRGAALLQATLVREDVDVVSVADAYDVWRDRAVLWCKKEQKKIRGFSEFEKMLEHGGLDAVIIATPDHIHAPAILAALDSRLDVYCEKPMTLTWEQARTVRDRAAENGAVFQVGTQLRSQDLYQKARDLVRAGSVGKLAMVQVNRHFKGMPLEELPVPAEANASNVHWEAFLRDTKPYPFDLKRYFHWRQFEEYSNGLLGDLMLHHLDACQFITGCGMPQRVASLGGVYVLQDGRTCADTVGALVEYPEAFQFNFVATSANEHYGLVERYLGTEGTIEIRDMAEMSVFKQDLPEEVIKSNGPQEAPHLDNFFQCMRTRAETVAPVTAGYAAATVCHMATVSQRQSRMVRWEVDHPVVE